MAKPLKRHAALVPLSQDHHFGLLLVWKIRKGLKVGFEKHRIADYLEYFFESHLEPHFELEEKQLFPFLPEEDLHRKKVEMEHQELRDLRTSIASSDKATVGDQLEKFCQDLEAHIRFEERELFQHMQAVLDADQLEELEEKVHSIHEKVEDTWEDQFWS